MVIEYFDDGEVRPALSEGDFTIWDLKVRDGVRWRADHGEGKPGCAEDALQKCSLLFGQWGDLQVVGSELAQKRQEFMRDPSKVMARKPIGYATQDQEILYTISPLAVYSASDSAIATAEKLESFLSLMDPRWTCKALHMQNMPLCTKDPGFHDFVNDPQKFGCCGCNRRLLFCFYPPQPVVNEDGVERNVPVTSYRHDLGLSG